MTNMRDDSPGVVFAKKRKFGNKKIILFTNVKETNKKQKATKVMKIKTK